MRIRLSFRADENYEKLSVSLRKTVDKQFTYLARDLRHPSLRAKKYDEASDLWQARVNDSWRFYFLVENDLYIILSIRKHPK